jgi:hypothetical protein
MNDARAASEGTLFRKTERYSEDGHNPGTLTLPLGALARGSMVPSVRRRNDRDSVAVCQDQGEPLGEGLWWWSSSCSGGTVARG